MTLLLKRLMISIILRDIIIDIINVIIIIMISIMIHQLYYANIIFKNSGNQKYVPLLTLLDVVYFFS